MKFKVGAVTKFVSPMLGDSVVVGDFSSLSKGDSINSSRLDIDGWALSNQVNLTQAVLYLNDEQIETGVNIESPDVKALYPDAPGSGACRFLFELDLSVAKHITQIFIAVIDDQGNKYGMGVIVLNKLPVGLITQPIFIVGSPRSGTSILSIALIDCLQLGEHAVGEGHFMPLVHDISCRVEKYFIEHAEAAKIAGVFLNVCTSAMINNQLANSFKSLYRQFYKEDVFIDKTPGWQMIEAIPSILRIYPDAYFIFAKRRGLENIVSRQKKFPEIPFVEYCQDWAAAMDMWLAVKGQIDPAHRLEIDQYALAHTPQHVVDHIQKMLSLPGAYAKNLLDFFTTQKIEQTSSDWQAVSWESLDWSERDKRIFLDECGGVMDSYGYSTDANYFKNA